MAKEMRSAKIPSESTIVEWKPSLSQINEIINTISAFSNTEGGRTFIGVSKTGKIVGIQIGKGSIENLTNSIFQNTDPKINSKITTKKIKGKEIIIIDVKEFSDHLVLAFGRPCKRVGKSTVRMSKDEYERLILEKHKEKLRFDIEVCKKSDFKEIDKNKVKNFLREAKSERGLDINEKNSLEEILMRLKLYRVFSYKLQINWKFDCCRCNGALGFWIGQPLSNSQILRRNYGYSKPLRSIEEKSY